MEKFDKFSSIEQAAMEQSPASETDVRHNFVGASSFLDDIVDGVVRAIDRPYGYQIFNLGKGAGTTLNEFISLVEKHVGKKANINQMPAQLGDVPFTNADVSKANRLLGYSSKTTFEEGIEKTVTWHKETYGEDGMKEVDR